ncbi:MAG: NAD-dependent epimerase/dehydratase family protein [Acidimicrobiia bacterium]|nr:NAD-dependent epimerase/dehydratase family protein [Acidimicrobiia bacterium]
MKKILLTGSSGYLGSKFIELYGTKYEILGLSRSNEVHRVDLLDSECVIKISADFKPDFILHTAAMVGRDKGLEQIFDNHVGIMKTLIECAKQSGAKFIFTSSESLYGGKENTGGYMENDLPRPRHKYGESKYECERLLQESGITYLITRSGRFVGFNKNYDREKQFPDTLKVLLQGLPVKLDAEKLFSYTLIDHLADAISNFVDYDSQNNRLLNVAAIQGSTYFDLISKIAKALDIDSVLVQPGGSEENWLPNSTIDTSLSARLGYPTITLSELVKIIAQDYLE